MEPILKTVAREYSSRYPSLKNICFLFPNKRCRTFLRKYFLEYGVITEDLPHILTVSEFVAQLARRTEAGRIEQLFCLYNSYIEILDGNKSGVTNTEEERQPVVDFEMFKGWAETVISDFNTVDLNLADPWEVFKNVKDLREITSNFLSEEQKEVMKEYFGIEDYSDGSEFWKSFSDPSHLSSLQQNFINLWQILAPLHEKFLKELEEKGLGTVGSIYRRASERILEEGRDALPYKKIVAVGFNALTESERTIFKELRESEGYPGYDDFIDFIWDATGPILKDNNFTASKFVSYNKKHFPAPEWLKPELDKVEVFDYPEIRIISAPSNTSQTKVATEILSSYVSEKGKEMFNEEEVALVLPDESLLSNMLYSVPDGIDDINLTMGLSLRHTPASSFISLLRRAFATMRESKDERVFYVKDLKILLSHPYCYALFQAGEIESLFEFFRENHKVSVKLGEILEIVPDAGVLLSFPSKKEKGEEIFDFIAVLFSKLISSLQHEDEQLKMSEDSNIKEDSSEMMKKEKGDNQDVAVLTIYGEYLDALRETMRQYSMQISSLSLLQMAERVVAGEMIGFEGEPLIGLQVMGTLETRSLDFKHVIILSMNEGIMPRKAISSSFIPESLRKAYGLPPSRYAEEIFGYYFYRLISRAEKVTLVYDGRVVNGMRGGVSRYILQLRHFLPADKLKEESWQFELQNREIGDASIIKTPEIMRLLDSYTTSGEGRKNFSASSLNTYRECEVRFFLRNVLNINSDPQGGDYMDAITVGNILHDVMMELYMPHDLQGKLLESPILMDKEKLQSILDNPSFVSSVTKKKVSKYYFGDKEGKKYPDSGVIDIMSEQIGELVMDIVRYDLSLAPFKLYGCEISRNIRVKMKSGRVVNFRFAIDRLDEIKVDGESRFRIVDYKTGGRKRETENLEEMFGGGYKSEQLFQLFIYAWLLGKVGFNGWEDVITEIYFVPDLVAGKGGLPKIGKKVVKSFRPYYEEFSERLEELVESIFINEKFQDSHDLSQCSLCDFKTFCKK